jgi:feruloyl esterase
VWARGCLLTTLALAYVACGAVNRPAAAQDDDGVRCGRLAQLTMPTTRITNAGLVTAGSFDGPPEPYSGIDVTAFYKALPAFCRVSATAKPTPDSDIKIEVWLPLAGWNNRFQGHGNGGFAGSIEYVNLGNGLKRGYVTAETDTGHTGSALDATWASGHPEKVVDFGHRAVHEMTLTAKAVIRNFYGEASPRAYFLGCSDGGREALMEAQRYPDDYDGILAGAPANYWTALLATAVWHTRALTLEPGSFIPPAKIPTIASAVNAACDALDDVKDGVLNDPRRCTFNPASIQCKAGEDTAGCLTEPQVVALRKIYDGLRDDRGRQIFPGFPPGAEAGDGGWTMWITGSEPGKSLLATFGHGYFSNMVYAPGWDMSKAALDRDLEAAVEKTAAALDATNPDLRPFHARGGKLVIYHGWQDPAIPAVNSVNYYDSIVTRFGRDETEKFVRLYLAPGIQHCFGGPGPGSFGQVGEWTSDDPAHSLRLSLEQWVEKGAAPSTVIASKREGEGAARHVTMTRPLCPYPQEARYKGTGDTNDAANFTCATTPR